MRACPVYSGRVAYRVNRVLNKISLRFLGWKRVHVAKVMKMPRCFRLAVLESMHRHFVIVLHDMRVHFLPSQPCQHLAFYLPEGMDVPKPKNVRS